MPRSVPIPLSGLFVLLLLGSLLLPTVPAVAEGSCFVLNEEQIGSYRDLQSAIDAASPGDVLVVKGTCTGNFVIGKPLGLHGPPGTSLYGAIGAALYGTITVTPGTVATIRHMILQTAIESAGTLTLRNDAGSPTAHGRDGTLYVIECYFTNTRISSQIVRLVRSTLDGTVDFYTIYQVVSLTIVGSTITGAHAVTDNDSGAIYGVVRLHVIGSTIAGNINVEGDSAGIENDPDAVIHMTVSSSILADNSPSSCDGVLHSGGYNIVDNLGHGKCQFQTQPTDQIRVDPLLGPLSDNGGFAPTLQLLPGSPAIDAIPVGALGANNGHTQLCPVAGSTDERGVARPQGTACDIGAVESAASAQTGASNATNSRAIVDGS